jgi:autotransporter-associated beta strand protein
MHWYRLRSRAEYLPEGGHVRVRRALLGSTMLAGAVVLAALTGPAFADGGAGGQGVSGGGGTGGIASATGAGGDGGTASGGGSDQGGGGGGGAGAASGGLGGGNGGASINGPSTVPGGPGATSAGGSGDNGTNAGAVACTPCGAGGGGGGAHGAVVTTSTTNSSALSGGNGGAGGAANGGGGGGGAAGHGGVVNGSGLTYTNNSLISGGNGGAGGIGVLFTGAGTLINSGSISGGNGGAGGTGSGGATNGTAGAGGAGVMGTDLTIINSGTISGGTNPLGSPAPQPNAISFTGGTNRLELRAGSTINGNVVALGASNTLTLGGGTDSSFNVSQIGSVGSGQQYQGFDTFDKRGGSTWTLTGTNAGVTPWTIRGGTLAISQDANLGAVAGGLTLNGGTLQFLSGFTSSRNFTVAANGGAFDSGTSGTSVTLSGTIGGPGSLDVQGAGLLTLTGTGSHIGGDLELCNCATGGLTISGGSLQVDGFSEGVAVFGGTLSVTNGGTLVVGTGPTPSSSLLVASNMIIDGAGSTVTVAGLTGVGIFGPGTLTIRNGGVLNSQIGAEIDSLFATSTVTVTGPGSTWNVGGAFGFGLTVGGGTTSGPGTLTIANGGVVNSTTFTTIGDSADGSSKLTVTGAGSVLNAFNSLEVGGPGCGCGPTVGTLTIADGGVVNSPGTTSIGAGSTLNLGIGGLAGTINTPAIANDGSIVANFTDTLVLGAAISGAGTLSKAGVGTLILTGTNTYSGGTTITGGTLQLGNGGTSGSLTGDVVNNGVFAVNRSDTLTLGGAISGTGAFRQIGTGTTILTAANTYTGATNVNAGTLQTGIANALSTATAVTVASGATFNLNSFNQSIGSLAGAGNVALGAATLTTGNDNTSTTFSGTISGSGSLTKVGTGTLTLAGASTYSGGTTIAGGTLSLANNQALGTGALTTTGSTVDYASGVTIGNSIVVNSNTTKLSVTTGSATQAGAISELNGPRPLEKIGAGTLVLSGVNTYSGPTTVSGGALVVTGSIANSAVTVGSGATLTGTGTVGATTVASGGTFAPGPIGTPGAMTVNGNLAFQSGAIYLVQVNPANASSANAIAGGSATLAGTVQAAFASGSYITRNYTILSAAGGLNGTFNALSTSNLPAGFTANLSYTANSAILNLTATLAQPSGPSGPSALGAAGFNVNQLNVANSLNGFFNNGGALPPNFVSVFGLTGGNLVNALSQLSGETATGGQQVGFQLTNQFLSLMLDPFVDGRSGVAGVGGPALGFAPEQEELPENIALAYSSVLKAPPKPASFDQRWSVWGAGFGGSNRTSGDQAVVGSHDLSANVAGFAGGFDYRVTPDTVIGIAFAGAGTSWGLAQGLGTGKSDAFQAGLYGATRWGAAYLAAAFAYGNHWMSTDRIAFANDHLTADFNAQSLGGRVEGGYRFATWYGGVTPYAAIQAQSFRTPGYSEIDPTNGGFGLAYSSRTGTDTRSELGARFDRALALYTNAVLSFRGRVAWAHDWVSDPTLAAAFQTLPGASFLVNGAIPAKDSALASAGAEYRLANGITLLGKFDGEFASHSSTYAGTGTVRYSW